MTITLVGNGRRGKIITKLLAELGFDVDYTVDIVSSIYKKFDEAPITDKTIIALPPDQNFVALESYAKTDTQILIEKPPTLSYAVAKKFIDRKGIWVVFPERYNSAIEQIKKVNGVFAINCYRIGPKPYWGDIISPTLDLTVHDRDLVNYIYGINNSLRVQYFASYNDERIRKWELYGDKGETVIDMTKPHNGLKNLLERFMAGEPNNTFESFTDIIRKLESREANVLR
jgi:predicted dehydrogenase